MLAYDKKGSGIPLVFLHAFPLTRSMWASTVDRLSRHFQVITMDMPGFGESQTQKDLSISTMAQGVLETLDSIGLKEKVVFAGLSMGGYVVCEILKQAPNRIRALSFISTRAAADTPEAKEGRAKNIKLVQDQGVKALINKMIPNLFGDSTLDSQPSWLDEEKKNMEQASPEGICAALKAMAERPDSSGLVSQAQTPILVVSGQEDKVVKSTEMEAMANTLKKCDFRVLEKAGHLLNFEQPEAFHSEFLHFLKRRVL